MKTRTSKRKSGIGSVLANLAGKALLVAAAFALLGAGTANAAPVDMFGGWTLIGDTDNPNDDVTVSTYGPWGAVDYEYYIAHYEVSGEEFVDSGVGDGNTHDNTYPATNVDLHEAKKFANYLTQAEHGGSTSYNLYTTDGSDFSSYSRSQAITDNKLVYGIPTEDEWYKAAYGDKNGDGVFDDYSTYANADATTPPPDMYGGETRDGTRWNYNDNYNAARWVVGGSPEEQNGTHDMMGNVEEWVELQTAAGNGLRRGGNYGLGSNVSSSGRDYVGWTAEYHSLGFRVVAIPEPASVPLFVLVGGLLWFARRRVRARA